MVVYLCFVYYVLCCSLHGVIKHDDDYYYSSQTYWNGSELSRQTPPLGHARLVSSDVETVGTKSRYFSFQAGRPAEDEDWTVGRRLSDGARRDVGGEMSSAIGAEASRLAVAGDDVRPSTTAAVPANNAT